MKKTMMSAVMVAFLVGAVASAGAYHITGQSATNSPPGTTLTSADWQAGAPGLITCETDGADDPRLQSPEASPVSRSGVGGLCTTGEGYGTGAPPPVPAYNFNRAIPTYSGEYVRIDVCAETVFVRGGLNVAAGTPVNPCSVTDEHAYTLRVGPHQCFIPREDHLFVFVPDPTVDLPSQQTVTADYAGFYDRMFAYWIYDSPGPHLEDSAPGSRQLGEEAGFHGHATVFIDFDASVPGASPTGSVETTHVTITDTSGLTNALNSDGMGGTTNPWNWSNNCGGSPADDGSGPGPVLRAPYNADTGNGWNFS